MTEPSEAVIHHLQFIQGVISRMNSNAFALKALAATITAAVLAYTGAVQDATFELLLAGVVPVVVFWLMDAQYLRQERLFRKLYDGVRKGEIAEPFDMNFKKYEEDVDGVFDIALSWSVFWFYLTLGGLLGVLAIVTLLT